MYNQTIRSLLVLALLVSILFAVGYGVAWDGTLEDSWAMVGASVLAAGFLGMLLFRQFRKERLPDLLGEHFEEYFEKKGLCFQCVAEQQDDQGIFKIFVQNRYQGPLRGTIAIRPHKESFVKPFQISPLTCTLECPGGAFGVLEFPFFLATPHQGSSVRFAIGADVEFIVSKGKLLRFRDGTAVGLNAAFKNHLNLVFKAVALLAGFLVLSSPPSLTLIMPRDIKEGPAADPLKAPHPPELHVLWEPEQDSQV